MTKKIFLFLAIAAAGCARPEPVPRTEPGRIEATYPAGLPTCVIVARNTFEALRLPLTTQDVRPETARICSETEDGTPIAIEIQPEGTKVRVAFVVGMENTGNNKRTALQVKAVFDQLLFRGNVEH